MKTYVSFGQDHVHYVNGKTFDRNCIAVIEAPSEREAREIAFKAFGPKFCFTYPEGLFDYDMSLFPRGFIPLEE